MQRSAIGVLLLVGALATWIVVARPWRSMKPTDDHTIRVVRNVGGRSGFQVHWNAWQSAFESANPGWRMQLVDIGDADAVSYYKARIATDDLPDVLMTWNLTRALADGRHIAPLDDSFFTQHGIPKPPAYRGRYYTGGGGRQYAGMLVNRAIWSAAGIVEPPRTWEQFLDGLSKIQSAGRVPLVYGAGDWTGALLLEWMIQVDVYARDGTTSWTRQRDSRQVMFQTDPNARAVGARMVDFLDKYAGAGALSDGYPQQERAFFTGDVGTWFMGPWIAGDLEPNRVSLDLAYWPLPSMTGRPACFLALNHGLQDGWAIRATATGEKAAKARAVLAALYEPTVYQTLLDSEGMLEAPRARVSPPSGPPISSSQPTTSPSARLRNRWPTTARWFESFEQSVAQYGSAPGWCLAPDDVPPTNMKWERTIHSILTGERNVDRLLAAMDDEWDRARKND